MDVITRCCHCNCVKTKYGYWLHNVKIRKGADDSDFLISELEEWLASNRYITQHRTAQAFLTYLWQHDGNFKDRTGFVSWVKCTIGFADINTTEAMIQGEKVIFKKFLPWSLSFGSCSQKKHQLFFDKLKNFANTKYKIDFDLWLNEYETGVQ